MLCEISRQRANEYWTIEQLSASLYCQVCYAIGKGKNLRNKPSSSWKNGQKWAGIRTNMGYNQEAYAAECAAVARALETASRRQTTPEMVTIFTDAQAAIRRIASEEPGPSQMYALQARKHIAVLRRAKPDITIEIRWCPAHKGVPGNEKANEWAKLAAEKPHARAMPLPRSLSHLKQEISEKKWAEARQWAGGWTSKEEY